MKLRTNLGQGGGRGRWESRRASFSSSFIPLLCYSGTSIIAEAAEGMSNVHDQITARTNARSLAVT